MTRDVRTARLDTSIGQAAAWMATGRFGCLPVVDAEGALLGIVCESDLAKRAKAQQRVDHSERQVRRVFPANGRCIGSARAAPQRRT